MREQKRILDIQKRAEELASFCKTANKFIFADSRYVVLKNTSSGLRELSKEEARKQLDLIGKFKNKATGMIENLLEIMTIQ